jgi:hypothetical protein
MNRRNKRTETRRIFRKLLETSLEGRGAGVGSCKKNKIGGRGNHILEEILM